MFEFARYSQTDPRWKNALLGFDDESTLGKYGCLLTCLSMVATGFGFDVTPAALNEKLKANAGFVGAYLAWGGVPKALPGVTVKRLVDCDNTPAPLAEIDAALAAGFPVIIEVDYENTPGYQYHWIVLYGKRDGDYLLQDPYPYPPPAGEVLLTKSRYAFAGAPDRIITGAAFLEGPIKKPAAGSPQSSASTPAGSTTSPSTGGGPAGLKVYASEADLALRSSPSVGATNLIKRLPLQSELSALEPENAARGKLGVVGQWLRVRDASGVEGYVAAWYVSSSKEKPAPASSTGSATPAPGALVVRTTTPDVALRSQPVLGDQTLIKRLPFNTRLTVLNPAAEASRKIGVVNQWLRVRDPQGIEGHVAAWYVAV
ncbi:MAG TPA: C39 family peptidase [Anaerolineae bacterium]|nr:C39 family peptidase [Anaerolineae bacterium]